MTGVCQMCAQIPGIAAPRNSGTNFNILKILTFSKLCEILFCKITYMYNYVFLTLHFRITVTGS